MTPEVPSDPERKLLQVLGRPLSYTDEGQGIPLVAVHGLPGSARDYRWLAPALPQGIRLIRVEMPAYGESPSRGLWQHRPAARARLLRAFSHALALERPVALGHSFGGMAVTEWAATDPGVAALVLVNSVGRRLHRGLQATMPPPRARWMAVAVRTPGVAGRLLPKMRAAMERAGFKHGLTDAALVAMVDCLSWIHFPRHRAHLAQLRVPTMVAWASDDPLIEEEISEDLYWACPSGPRLGFGEGGHNLQKTRAVELGEALGAWLPDTPAAR